MIQTLYINASGFLTVTARYPTIQILQINGATGGGGVINTDNQRVKVSGSGTFTQIKNPSTGLWHTVMVDQNQVVVGAGEA